MQILSCCCRCAVAVSSPRGGRFFRLFEAILKSKKVVFRRPEAFGEALVEQGRPQSASEPFCEPFGSHVRSMLGRDCIDFLLEIMSGIEVEKK